MDLMWSDVSEFQTRVTDDYPYQVLAIRANDGTRRDLKFQDNHAWAKAALNSGKLRALIIYMVYRPNWLETLNTTKAMVGTPHPGTACMIDVENWTGEITGNQSDGINCLYWGLADWLGDPRRVIAYGNTSDLTTLWPTKPPGVRLIVASYGANPDYPGKLGHQFTDGAVGGPLLVPPFGYADVDSADGYDLDKFCEALNLTPTRKRQSVIKLPMTAGPTAPGSKPATWPQRNWNVGWPAAGGPLGDVTISFGVQDWNRWPSPGETPVTPDADQRGYLQLASWIMRGGNGVTGALVPIDELYTAGKGATIDQHGLTLEYTAPAGCVGVTLNYAAPGGAYLALGRSG